MYHGTQELEERTHVQVCRVDTPVREADVGLLGVRTSHHMTIVYNGVQSVPSKSVNLNILFV